MHQHQGRATIIFALLITFAAFQYALQPVICTTIGDPYANSVVEARTRNVLSASDAIGAPDGSYATIFFDYDNGDLTLDMGVYEEIIDEEGFDFAVHATETNYSVWVSNSLGELFTSLGHVTGNHSFDLQDAGLSTARYVRLSYFSGNDAQVDAVEAFHYYMPADDNDKPLVSGPSEIDLFEDEPQTAITWTCSDATPLSYSILVNGTVVESGSWNGSSITFVFVADSLGVWEVNLTLTDFFQNSATAIVYVTVQPSSPGPFPLSFEQILGVAAVLGVVMVVLVVGLLRKRT
ncbi:MAG: hypothetical protein ACXABY_10275 [Candidatus Thorarchaeota archaeon]|jgi:hypothetical protein